MSRRITDFGWRTGGSADSLIGIYPPLTEAEPDTPFVVRKVHLEGAAAYDLGPRCETCRFWFERLEGAQRELPVGQISERLAHGVDIEGVVGSLADCLPEATYSVSVLELAPRFVDPLQSGDYFADEQLATWGPIEFWGLPHFTRVGYYREPSRFLDSTRLLTEFVAPLIPAGWLDEGQVARYRETMLAGQDPHCFALSFIDEHHSPEADFAEEPDDSTINVVSEMTDHVCVCHLLLDGHHKLRAAVELGRPIRLVSFLLPQLGNVSADRRDQVVEEAFSRRQ